MKRKTLALGVAALAAGLAGAALAQQQMGGMATHDPFGNATITRAEAQTKAAEMFARMDLNNDGKLDAGDRAVMIGRRFDAMDANHDGVLSRQEFLDAHQKMMGGAGHDGGPMHERMERGPEGGPMGIDHPGGGHPGRGMKMMERMDANGDHAITRDEFLAGALKRFDAADANHDGKLTPEERRAAMRQGMMRMHRMHGMGAEHGMGEKHGMGHDMDDMPPPPPAK
jgi:Ca2+-binding EF-hand superfamily protein